MKALIGLGLLMLLPLDVSVQAAAPTVESIDPERLAAAGELLELLHLDRQYDQIFAQMTPVMSAQIFASIKDNVQVPANVRAYLAEPANLAEAQRIFTEETLKGFKTRYGALRAATAREYALAFTNNELRQLIAFYGTPVGQKVLTTMPQLQSKLMPIGMVAGQQVGKEAIIRTFDRLNLEPPAPRS